MYWKESIPELEPDCLSYPANRYENECRSGTITTEELESVRFWSLSRYLERISDMVPSDSSSELLFGYELWSTKNDIVKNSNQFYNPYVRSEMKTYGRIVLSIYQFFDHVMILIQLDIQSELLLLIH